MVSQPLADLSSIGLQAGDALGFFGLEVGLNGTPVFFTMPLEHDTGSGFELGGLALEAGTGATLGLGGVARQLHAINGKPFDRLRTGISRPIKP